jgi:phage/plasmid-like protein (TIGR03299 family)
MAHNLNERDGKVAMFYHGATPWHSLGTKVDKALTAQEAIKTALMDFTVVKAPIMASYEGKMLPVEDKFATLRTDTRQVLGTVGERYEIVQNSDAFTFFDVLVGEDEAMYETAGVLGKGQVIWILAKLPGFIKVKGQDIVEKYLLLMNSHNGTSTLRAKLTPVRVVCENTLNAALGGKKSTDEVRIQHTISAHDRLEQAHKVLGLSNAVYNDLGEIFSRMSLTSITGTQLINYVKGLVPDNDEATKFNTRTANIREKIFSLHESGAGSELARGTIWGAYNAVTEYVDHVWGKNTTAEKKLESMWLGTGAKLKEQAFKAALELAEIKN